MRKVLSSGGHHVCERVNLVRWPAPRYIVPKAMTPKSFRKATTMSDHKTHDDTIVTWIKEHNLPLTRDGYLALAYPEGEPLTWDAEDEATLPPEIRLSESELDALDKAALKAHEEDVANNIPGLRITEV
jgi:hypothetical protein